MRFPRIIVFLIVIFVSFQDNFSQEKPVLIAEFGRECSEQIMARHDNFLTAIYNQPNSTGYYVFMVTNPLKAEI